MKEETKRESVVGLREPITGLRQSIVDLRVPIKLEDVAYPEMNWETQYNKLNNYIKYVAGQVVSGLPSAMMSSEDLYQEGLILLYTCFEKYKLKPESEFQALFKASCWRLLKGFCYKRKEFQTVDLDEIFDMGYDDNVITDMYDEFRLQQVFDLLSDNNTAMRILKEILYPSHRTVWEAEMDFSRKEFLKAQGKRVFASSEIEVKPDMVRRSLGINSDEFNEAFKYIRSVVYSVYSVDYDIKSYQETDTLTDEEFQQFYGELIDTIQNLKLA